MPVRTDLLALTLTSAVVVLSGCAEKPGSVPEVPAEEITSSVPELSAVHEFMEPLWHDAFPARDFQRIQELVPEFEPALAALEAVELPGILQDKAEAWNEGKAALGEAFQGLKAAAEAGNEAEMLGYTETFHMGYERLVGLIRPPLPELEAVHKPLYSMFHHYGPGYDLEKIRGAAVEMAAAIPDLQNAALPSRLSDHQAHFEMAVNTLGESIGALMATLDDPSREAVTAAIDAVHTAYAEIDGIFTDGSHG